MMYRDVQANDRAVAPSNQRGPTDVQVVHQRKHIG